MDVLDPTLIAATITLIAAAGLALAADYPTSGLRQAWRFPAAVTGIAIVNLALTIAIATSPNKVTGTIVLGTAMLLVYAIRRRLRATIRQRPHR
jgi:hypothetical protein